MVIQNPGFSNLWTHYLTQERRQRLGSGCIVQQRSRFFKITQQTQPTILSHRTNVLLSVSVVRCKSCIDFLYPLLCIFKKKLFTTVSRVRLNSVNSRVQLPLYVEYMTIIHVLSSISHNLLAERNSVWRIVWIIYLKRLVDKWRWRWI